MTREYNPAQRAKPERDGVVCESCGADEELTATPAGQLCRECADELADELRGDQA